VETLPIAISFLRVQMGAIDRVHETLKQIPNVRDICVVYGNYDIVTQVEANSMSALKHLVTNTIRRLNDIRTTQTLIVMDE
jgi:DNA-binding Lrp family transcriptional regulator